MINGKIVVGISQGDTNGVGIETIMKVFAEPLMFDLCVPVVYSSPKIVSYHRKAIESTTIFYTLTSAKEVVAGRLNLVDCCDEEVKIDFGEPTAEGGRAAFMALERAVADWRAGLIDVLVTAPINKSVIQSDEFRFTGHTEYLANRLGADVSPLMILTDGGLRVALVSIHAPISEVASSITTEAIESRLRLFDKSLKRDFAIDGPRIAVLALNPHAGDNGLLGKEEKEVIIPTIEKVKGEGIYCFGPYAADGFFGSQMWKNFDGVLAMYHDQGLAPFKAIAMEKGVNFTASLPMVRTSPDHGTAYDIAGKGVADETSMRQAIYTALDIYRNRKVYDEAHASPLPKLYYERGGDE